jgi:predicted 3-demethylubiquinone-9 3-methyltransferase (glyoxalase superfamily)
MARIDKIRPFLWFKEGARDAAEFYAAIFPDSRVDNVWTLAAESPAGPPGSVEVAEFTLAGQRFTAMAAGEMDPFNHAISLYVSCEDQAEVDRYWEALLADGGQESMCGWLTDRFGLSWQIVPVRLYELMGDPDPSRAKAAAEAMLSMRRLVVADLEAAADAA